jgi:WD40 repeat protein
MRIVAVADTHLYHADLNPLPDGDVLIQAGDLLRSGKLTELREAVSWLRAQPHRHKIVIAGNHDWCFVREPEQARQLLGDQIVYLQDSGTEIDGVRFWGSPWQPEYHNWAFNLPRGEPLAAKWRLIPDGTDVLITHGPPRGIGDRLGADEHEGCDDLLAAVGRVQPVLHLFGHIHPDGGLWRVAPTWFANVTTWESERGPTVLDLDRKRRRIVPVSVPPATPARRTSDTPAPARRKTVPNPAPALGPGSLPEICALNNRALSLLDLDKPDEALALWEEALRLEGQHPESTYNRGLLRWRRGEITDEALLRELGEAAVSRPGDWLPPFLLAQVHLERGDCASALDCLWTAQDAAPPGIDAIQQACAFALSYLDVSRHQRLVPDEPPPRNCSADGRYLVTTVGEKRQEVEITDVLSGEVVSSFRAATQGPVLCLALGGDGSRLLTGGNFLEGLKLWDAATGRCLRELYRHEDRVTAAALGPDGKRALSAIGPTLTLWDADTGQALHRMAAGERVKFTAAAVHPDWRLAVSAGTDQAVRVWDLETGECLRVLRGHNAAAHSVCLSPDGRQVLSAAGDLTLRLWDVATGRCLRTFTPHAVPPPGEVCFSPDGRSAFSWNLRRVDWQWQEEVRQWSLAWEWTAPGQLCREADSEQEIAAARTFDGLLVQARRLVEEEPVRALELLREARALPGFQRRPEVVALWTGLYLRLPRVTLQGAWEVRTFAGHPGRVSCVHFTADGRRLLSAGHDGTLRLWDVSTGQCLRTFEGHEGAVTSACLSADDRRALSGGLDRSVRLWDLETGECLRHWPGHFEQGEERPGGTPGSGSDWEFLLHATGSALRLMQDLMDKLDGGKKGRPDPAVLRRRYAPGHSSAVRAVALSPDGRLALSGAEDGTLRLWEVAEGRRLHVLEGHEQRVNAVAFHPDGRLALSAGSDKTLRLWDVASGKCMRTFQGHEQGVRSVCWSRDGRTALSCSDVDRTVELWEAATGRCLVSHEHFGSPPVCLAAAGRHALAADGDTFKLWEVSTGRCLREFAGHGNWPDTVDALALSADGHYALSAGPDLTFKLWLLDWELQAREPADWDAGAWPYLAVFLNRHLPYTGKVPNEAASFDIEWALARHGRPTWTEEDFQRLLHLLGCAGHGRLRPEGVRRKLESQVRGWWARDPRDDLLRPREDRPRPGGWRAWLAWLLGRD